MRLGLTALCLLSVPSFAFADAVLINTNASQLASAVTAGNTGITVTKSTLQGQTSGSAASTGTFTNIYGLKQGVVLSTGNAAAYGSGPNTEPNTTTNYGTTGTAAENVLLDPITGGNMSHHDVTELTLNFTTDANVNKVFFNVAFGSEEYPEYVGSQFVDAFGLYLNGVNIASVGGKPVNIDNPCFQSFAGTELDGVLACGGNPVNTFSGSTINGVNTLTFIISDTSDGAYDTTAYIGALGSVNPTPTVTPEPASLLLMGTGAVAAAGAVRRRLF